MEDASDGAFVERALRLSTALRGDKQARELGLLSAQHGDDRAEQEQEHQHQQQRAERAMLHDAARLSGALAAKERLLADPSMLRSEQVMLLALLVLVLLVVVLLVLLLVVLVLLLLLRVLLLTRASRRRARSGARLRRCCSQRRRTFSSARSTAVRTRVAGANPRAALGYAGSPPAVGGARGAAATASRRQLQTAAATG